jgi:hypothetical protein
MPTQLSFPDAPVDDRTRAVIVERLAWLGIDEDVDRESHREIVDEIGTSAEAAPVGDATEFDSVQADLPVGSWFG